MNGAVLSRTRGVVWAMAIAASPAMVLATSIQLVDPNTGADSGWQASFPDNAMVNLVVDAVTPDAVFIQKFVDFDQPAGAGGVIPAVNIDFTQTQPNGDTVPNIVIVDEALTNLTGTDWGGFDWLILGRNEAWFDVSLSSEFDTSPFVNQTFGGFLGGDANRATTLFTDGGVVPHLQTFFPGSGTGDLWIGIDLGIADITSFVLKERAVPEPTSLVLLGIGAALLARRRSRN